MSEGPRQPVDTASMQGPPDPPVADASAIDLVDDDPVARLCDRHPALDALWRWRVPLLVVVATVVGLAIAVRSRPAVLYDDAAIVLRYASRLADGQGWTYNPGDRTNGSTAPLYTMVLAA